MRIFEPPGVVLRARGPLRGERGVDKHRVGVLLSLRSREKRFYSCLLVYGVVGGRLW